MMTEKAEYLNCDLDPIKNIILWVSYLSNKTYFKVKYYSLKLPY